MIVTLKMTKWHPSVDPSYQINAITFLFIYKLNQIMLFIFMFIYISLHTLLFIIVVATIFPCLYLLCLYYNQNRYMFWLLFIMIMSCWYVIVHKSQICLQTFLPSPNKTIHCIVLWSITKKYKRYGSTEPYYLSQHAEQWTVRYLFHEFMHYKINFD